MEKKDLEQLNRDELLTMLLTVCERCDLLEKELTEAKKLMQDTSEIAGYVGPVSELLDATRRKCADMETDAKYRCDQMIERAQVESQNYWDEVYSRIKRYSQATETIKEKVAENKK